MKLDKEQLQHISAFISKRGFTHYDLQLEIIDHVACKVEELMTANPSLSLDEAIGLTHGQFGPNGFSVFEDAMRTSLRKRYWQLFRNEMMHFFQPLYVPLVLGSVYLLYLAVRATNSPEAIFYCSWGLLIVSMIVDGALNYRKLRRYRSMLTMQMGGISFIITNVVFQVYNMLHQFINANGRLSPNVPYWVCAVFVTCIALYYPAMHKVQKAALDNCRELEEQYQLTVG